ILDIEALDTLYLPIKEALQEMKLWNNVKETLLPKQLSNKLKRFIINQVKTGNALIPDDGDNLLYCKTQILIDSINYGSKDKNYLSNYGSEDKNYLSNYSSEDNNNNEKKVFYNDEREEKHKEISNRMFIFIPTYNTPRSSINHN
ncbi:25243_t:CDS:2, partial [Racocetra persica]